MSKNKFIPLAVLAGLCIVSFTMSKQHCVTEHSKQSCTMNEPKKQEVNTKTNGKTKNTKCKTGRCKKNKSRQ